MLKKGLFLVVLLPIIVLAGKLDRIKRAIDSGDYVKAQELIDKTIEKEPFNPGASYFQALLYQTTTYQRYHLDSARIAVEKCLDKFSTVEEKTLNELRDDGISLQTAIDLQTTIRDKQFQQLQSQISIENVTIFRSKYPNSIYDDVLEFKRDSIVFLNIKEAPSQIKLSQFIIEYPTSIFVPEAEEILDQLRYFELKRDGKLNEHYQFLTQYPKTNFREQIEEYILKHSTLDHSSQSYLAFIKFSETKKLKEKASNILYFITDQKEKAILNHPSLDSISEISRISNTKLFPVMDRNKFGFTNDQGELQIDFQFDQIEEKAKCVTITDDWIFVQKEGIGSIVDKRGNTILNKVEAYTNLTDGVALISQNGSTYLYHKSGFRIMKEPIDGAEVLESRWIKVKKDGKSFLVSFLGIPITETQYDDIYLEGTFWVFEKRELLAVYTEELIAEELYKKGLSLEFKFDDIELVGTNRLIGFRDDRECLLDEQLQFLIPWGNYVIHPDESGWYLKSEKGYQLYNSQEKNVLDRHFPYLESNNGWLALKTQEDWMLLPRKENILPSRGYDSLKLINDFVALTMKEDQTEIIFNNGSLLPLQEDAKLKTYINSNYISIRNSSDVIVYNENGESLISGKYDQVSFLNDTLLKVELNKKQGLMSISGETLFRPVFDIIDKQNAMIFLLEGNKIGCFDLEANVVFLPKYETRLKKIGEHYTAKLNGKYGLFDLEEQPILPFQYDEISFWNDSIFRVKKDNFYNFINSSEESMISDVELMSKLTTTADQEIWKFVKEGKYGLISTQKGILLEPEYTDIFNIGTSQEPLFFADQHLDKAGFHVVSYIKQEGELVFSKAYTKDEFELILCED